MSEYSQNSRRSILWYAFLILLMVAGAVAVFIRAKEGIIVTNLTSTTPWGTWVAFLFILLACHTESGHGHVSSHPQTLDHRTSERSEKTL